jgi:hypothetical protein
MKPSTATMLKVIGFAVAIAVTTAGCASTDADARKAAQVKAGATQGQPPDKPRYYGGPKSPMYPG